jgi:primase-polymerase (primpol)-like protein
VFKITDMVISVTEISLSGEYIEIKAFSESCLSPGTSRGNTSKKAGCL